LVINSEDLPVGKIVQLSYAAVAYALFLGAFLYAIGFVGDFLVPKTIDSGRHDPWMTALAIDAALLGLFAVQHSVMARPAFKRWWTRIVPVGIERSTYVAASSLCLVLLFWQWRPLGATAWALDGLAAQLVSGVFFLGWLVVLASTFMLSHFELFGLTQAYAAFRDRAVETPPFHTPMLYGLVRHPIMLGFLIAFWAAPVMTVGHLAFATATTLYILIALQLEESDLVASFGAKYLDYRRRVPMLVPFTRWRAPTTPKQAVTGQ
jgi:protein-S-isoprenylcysteine O-methyltransferase Ste14